MTLSPISLALQAYNKSYQPAKYALNFLGIIFFLLKLDIEVLFKLTNL